MAVEAFNVYNSYPGDREVPFLGLPGVRGGNIAYLTTHVRVPDQRTVRIERTAGDVADVIRLHDARDQVLEAHGAQLDQSGETTAPAEAIVSPAEQLYLVRPEAADADVAPLADDGVFAPRTVKHPIFKPEIVQPAPVAEAAERGSGRIRPATINDIARMVDADMRGFRDVYANYDQTEEEMRAELTEKFTGRFNKVGGDWIQVYEGPNGEFGFMMCCPTNKSPEEFESWEQTTDNGTLESTYDPNGKNIYIVSLTMEGCGEAARNMIFVNQIGKMIKEGREKFFFETRLPGLKRWIQSECEELGLDFDSLTDRAKLGFANRYFRSTRITSKGKEVPRDPLVRIYQGVGCTFDKVVPDAYVDEPSMNFGAVGVFANPMPRLLRNNKLATGAVGGTMQKLSRMPAFGKVAEKLF